MKRRAVGRIDPRYPHQRIVTAILPDDLFYELLAYAEAQDISFAEALRVMATWGVESLHEQHRSYRDGMRP